MFWNVPSGDTTEGGREGGRDWICTEEDRGICKLIAKFSSQSQDDIKQYKHKEGEGHQGRMQTSKFGTGDFMNKVPSATCALGIDRVSNR